MITIENVTVAFGRTLALDDVTLQITPGITGLFGQNGSGKTTLLRVLCGLQRPSSGSVTIDGRAVSSRDETLTRRIGYAGHASGLYPHLTVEENLALFAHLYGAPEERVGKVLADVGLEDRSGAPAGRLSAGYKRRAAVARALVHDPEVLLLDEPYANLDDDASARVSDAVTAWRRPGRVALVASHGAKKVKAYADAGIILQRGRVQVAGNYRRPQGVVAT